jgi:SAM-dependent methyltransferase
MDPRAFHDFEHAGWERAAAHYAGSYGALTASVAEAILDAARVADGMRVLDVATGPGYLAAGAARRGARVTGIDFSATMVADARRAHPSITFREGDAQRLGEPDAVYDAVVMGFGLLHLADPPAAIAEARRVLAPGGHFAFTVWARPEEAIGFGILLDALAAHGRPADGVPEGPPFFRYSDHAECRRALAAFTDVEVQTLPVVWHLDEPDQLFAAAMHGSVRTAALLRAQRPEALATIERVAREQVARRAEGNRYAIPMPVVLARGTA